MTTFLQAHILTAYPPANLNRDDLGQPKSARFGEVQRLRVSSQALKRAWRSSSVFQSALSGHLGTRTKKLGIQVYQHMIEAGLDAKKADTAAIAIASVFGKVKTGKKLKTDQFEQYEVETLTFIAPKEWDAALALASSCATEKRTPTDEELDHLRGDVQAADIGLFGRMLADAPRFNMDAAGQVAHAITVHKAIAENDYFTAVDDLNLGDVDRGSSHIGDTEFGAGLFYLYLCINCDLLVRNLQGDRDLSGRSLAALLECACTVAPGGKQNSFGSRAYASYCLAERGTRQPRSLCHAFLKPVTAGDMLDLSVERLETTRNNMDQVYGAIAEASCSFNAHTGSGSLSELTAFAAATCKE